MLFGIKTEVSGQLALISSAGYGIHEHQLHIRPIPSSAAVERLFRAAAQVLTARRCRMSDETLNQHIFLRSQFNVTG